MVNEMISFCLTRLCLANRNCIKVINRPVVCNLVQHFSTPRTLNASFATDITVHNSSQIGIKPKEEDTFGLLAEKHHVSVFKQPVIEEEMLEPHKIHRSTDESAFWYHVKCKKLAKQGKLDECIQLFEQQMLKEKKLQPQEYNFSVVIGALGRHGNVRKALELFKKLKEYGLTPSHAAYTGLFNAFANSSNRNDIEILKRVYKKLIEKNISLNRISFNALIRAYAKHTTLLETMTIFRDSIAAGFEPDSITFTCLLVACETDKLSGYRHALQIWRQMISMDCSPDAQCLVHFLRVLLNCNIGDLTAANKLLLRSGADAISTPPILKGQLREFRWLKGQESSPNPSKYSEELSSEPLSLNASSIQRDEISSVEAGENLSEAYPVKKHSKLVSSNTEAALQLVTDEAPNLLRINAAANVISISECPRPSERLQLIGGLDGVLNIIKQHNIIASTKMYTLLAQIIEHSYDTEENLMNIAKSSKAKLDVDFYNCIMRRRAKRRSRPAALEILEKIEASKLTPNYRTWCIRAMLCRGYTEGRELVESLKKENMKPGVIFLHTLISAALQSPYNKYIEGHKHIRYPDYRYLTFILQEFKSNEVKADETLIKLLETSVAWPKGYSRWERCDPKYEKKILMFRKVYKKWLLSTDSEEATASTNLP